MTIHDLARVLLRAADIAEVDLSERGRDAPLGIDGYSPEEWAAYRLLRWLADGANELAAADATRPAGVTTTFIPSTPPPTGDR